jgi:poly(3-hydroxyalkanoate) synthetase
VEIRTDHLSKRGVVSVILEVEILDTIHVIAEIVFATAVLAAVWLVNRRVSNQRERAANASDYIYREFDNIWRELSKREKSDAEKT